MAITPRRVDNNLRDSYAPGVFTVSVGGVETDLQAVVLVNPSGDAVTDTVYSVKLDEGATYTYVGESDPGSATSAAVWRIKRITNSDTTLVWADGDGNFDNIWDNRASLTYS